MPRVMKVIESVEKEGSGTEVDPFKPHISDPTPPATKGEGEK